MNKCLLGSILLISSLPYSSVYAQSAHQPESSRPQDRPTQSIASNKPTGPVEGNSSSNSKSSREAAERARHKAKEYCEWGVRYGRARKFQEAVNAFTQATRLQPNYIDAYYGLGEAYLDLGRWREGADALEKVVQMDPHARDAYAMLGQAYMRLKAETESHAVDSRPTGEAVALKPNESSHPVSREVVRSANPSSATRLATPAVGERAAADSLTPERMKLNSLPDAQLVNIYRVGVGDVLDVKLGDLSSAKSTLVTVSSDGLFEHPLLARSLRVQGLTTEEIGRVIRGEMKHSAVGENTEVLVSVRDYASHTILVSGLVKEPGTKILRREAIPLYVVLADAQVLPEATRLNIISEKASVLTKIDLTNPNATNVLVHPGDVVMVQGAQALFFYIGGEVKNPGEKPFRTGMRLTQALLAAGGLTPKANKQVEIAREVATQTLSVTRYKIKDINTGRLSDPLIEAGDRITVER